ncbi:hypothetical protein BGZ51_004210 [Haplosporangium sp. Z 767]|nr:hypothetical protein BGZ50_007295 [Haplosporangium sp. Z 11]KAF9183144.1 hypothetical protein BGZ51_004210 [Haplosporangium sp. Z 767]
MTPFATSLLLLVTAAITANAQQDVCSGLVVVNSEGDLAPIASCSSFSGSLAVAGTSMTALALPALQNLTGSIKVTSNPLLTTFSLDGLQDSTGSITLYNNTAISGFHAPNLKTIGSLEIVTAPKLKLVSLTNIQTLDSLKIEDTGLDNSGALPWSSLKRATDIGISNNQFLKAIDMPGLTTVSGRFVVAGNGLVEGEGKGSSLHISNLTSLSNCTLRHLTDLKAPSLAMVGANLSFDETNLMQIDVPKLTSVGQTLSIVSNNLLSNISFGELTTIGGALLIANNTELTTVDGFSKLKNISGVLNIRGAFTNITLPSVSTVQGGMSVLSSSEFDCSTLSKIKASAHGKTVCQSKVKSAKPTNSDDSSLESGAGMTSTATAWGAVAVLSSLLYIL